MSRNQRPVPVPMAPPGHSGASTRLLLICHAESMHRRYGDLRLEDSGLTALGWDQVTALAEWLHSYEQIDAIVCSRQLRSRLTAQRIGQVMGRPITVEPLVPDAPRQPWPLPPLRSSVDAENALTAYQRYEDEVALALTKILSDRWGLAVALVTHASAIATILRYMSGGRPLDIHLDPTSITELRHSHGGWGLAYCNRTEHLPRAPVSAAGAGDGQDEDSTVASEWAMARQIYNRAAARYQIPIGADRLVPLAAVTSDDRWLEVGSGPGQTALALAEAGAREVVGVDISPAMLEKAEYLRLSAPNSELTRRVSFRLAPASSLPFASGRFDGVLCALLLHHIRKPNRTLDELYRVLRPGGGLVLADLVGSDDPVKRATQNAIEQKRNPSHASVRTIEQQCTLVEQAGFEIETKQTERIERQAAAWLEALAVDADTGHAVTEMLEASMETDAAGLNVRRVAGELVFDQQILLLRARKPA